MRQAVLLSYRVLTCGGAFPKDSFERAGDTSLFRVRKGVDSGGKRNRIKKNRTNIKGGSIYNDAPALV